MWSTLAVVIRCALRKPMEDTWTAQGVCCLPADWQNPRRSLAPTPCSTSTACCVILRQQKSHDCWASSLKLAVHHADHAVCRNAYRTRAVKMSRHAGALFTSFPSQSPVNFGDC
mmetsp:Transcript_1266/g.2879  ORF Transcript_1266/g.2879 Transcript_1266/m.2879 type:complete len:114 (+) Transcript_1266:896-1237(+)